MIEGNSSVPGQIIHTFIPAQNKMYEWKDLRALVLPGRTDFKKTKKAKSPYISKKKRKKRSYVWIFQVYFWVDVHTNHRVIAIMYGRSPGKTVIGA